MTSISELGPKMSMEEVAEFFDLKPSTIRNNWQEYGGVKIGSRVLFFEKLIVDKVRERHALQNKRQEQNSVAGEDKEERPQGCRGPFPDQGGGPAMGKQGPVRGHRPLGGTRGPGYDPLGLTSGLGN